MLKAQGIAARVIDLYSCSRSTPRRCSKAAKETGLIVTVEDHYPAGGIGEAVMNAVAPIGGKVHQLAVRELPRSGRPEELVDKFGLSARHIVGGGQGAACSRIATVLRGAGPLVSAVLAAAVVTWGSPGGDGLAAAPPAAALAAQPAFAPGRPRSRLGAGRIAPRPLAPRSDLGARRRRP